MEVRQLRYFVTLAEELHFGRAAQREHIVQSGLSQQIRRLERDIGVQLVARTTHDVRLTPAGGAFLTEAREILLRLDRAAVVARRTADEPDVLRIGVPDAGYDFTPSVIDALQRENPALEVRQCELGVPLQYDRLSRGRLDVGVGCATLAPPGIRTEALRSERVGVFVSDAHRFASASAVAVGDLAGESLLLADSELAPEYNTFVVGMCERAGFTATPHHGTVQSVAAAIRVVIRRDCVAVFPRSVWHGSPGVRWVPLCEPVAAYTWSLLWHGDNDTAQVNTFVALARAHATSCGWLRRVEQDREP